VDAVGLLLAAPPLIALAFYLLAWGLVVGTGVGSRGRNGATAPRPAGVTILKPLCGIDEELEKNLVPFFELDHAPLQLVFGAADANDPAIALVRRLARRHPGRHVTIVTGANPDVANPKIAVLESLLPHARHGIILLSDSNVRLYGDEIARVLPAFDDPQVGMVYQPVVATGECTAAAAIENLHYTEYAAFLTIGAHVLAGQHTVNAKGQWVRRAALADIGDFAHVRDRGADDYEMSRLVQRAGWRLQPAAAVVRVVQRDWSWRSLVQRNLRHAGLRWRICPWAYPLELLFNPVPWVLPLLASGRAGSATIAAAVVCGKLLLELSAARLLRGVPLPARFVPLVAVKDLLIFGCWFVALFARTATWRDRRYRLCPGGRIEPLHPAAATGWAPSLRSAALVAAAWIGPLAAGLAAAADPSAPPQPRLRVAALPIASALEWSGAEPTGVMVDVWRELAGRLGLESDFKRADSFTKLMAMLPGGEADVALGPIAITEERERLFDLTHPIFHSGMRIAVRERNRSAFSSAFESLISWELLSLLGIVASLAILSGHLLWWFERSRNDRSFPREYPRGVVEATWWIASTIITGGCDDKHVDSGPGRMLAFAWMIGGIVLLASFTSVLTATMTAESVAGTIRGPRDLAGRTVGCQEAAVSIQSVKQRGGIPQEYPNLNEAIDALELGMVEAVVSENQQLMYLVSQPNRRNLRLVGPMFESFDYGIGLPSGSQLREDLNTAILRMREDGTLARLIERRLGRHE